MKPSDGQATPLEQRGIAGMGRRGELCDLLPFDALVERIKKNLGLERGRCVCRCVFVIHIVLILLLFIHIIIMTILSNIYVHIVRVAYAANNQKGDQHVRSVAVCAGSGTKLYTSLLILAFDFNITSTMMKLKGSSVLQGAQADVYITGEMSHHEILATGMN